MKEHAFLNVMEKEFKVVGYTSYINYDFSEEWVEYLLDDPDKGALDWIMVSKNSGEVIYIEEKDILECEPEIEQGFALYRQGVGEVIENDNGVSYLKSGDKVIFKWLQNELTHEHRLYKIYNNTIEVSYGRFLNLDQVPRDLFLYKSTITLDKSGIKMYDNINEYENSEEYEEEKFRQGIYGFYGIIILLAVIIVWVYFTKYAK